MVQEQTQTIDTQTTGDTDDTEYDDEVPNEETIAALKECDEMLKHPENYKWYDSFADLMADVFSEQADDD